MRYQLANRAASIRDAAEKDARAISALIRRNAEVVLSTHYSRDQLNAWKRYNTAARIRQRVLERTTFCAFRGRRLCGTIALDGNEMVGLYVSPPCRGQGIGQSLLVHVDKKVVLNIMGVNFEETFMSRRLNQT